MSSGTRIRVSESVWERLNREKQLGESFDDTLRRLLENDDVDASADK